MLSTRPRAEICQGRVFHQRLRPAVNRFSYGVFFLRVPLSTLCTLPSLGNRWLSVDRFNLLSFMTRDYGPRDGSSLEAWMRALLAREGLLAADGEIVLQTFPRVLGYVFNPISLWYCHDRGGRLIAVLAEVNNTFGERHDYLLAHDDRRPILPGDWVTARKSLHVSPFCRVEGHYRFRFEQSAGRAFAEIDYHDAAGKLIVTTLHGTPREATAGRTLAAWLAHPLMTVGVIARIHWQAVKLWWKRVPYVTKPAPPAGPRTLASDIPPETSPHTP